MKKVLTAILISYLCAGLALAGGYRAGAGARRPVAHYPLNVSGTIDPDSLAQATACWNFETAVGAGTGTRSAAQTTTHIGARSGDPANVWTQELKVYPRTKQ